MSKLLSLIFYFIFAFVQIQQEGESLRFHMTFMHGNFWFKYQKTIFSSFSLLKNILFSNFIIFSCIKIHFLKSGMLSFSFKGTILEIIWNMKFLRVWRSLICGTSGKVDYSSGLCILSHVIAQFFWKNKYWNFMTCLHILQGLTWMIYDSLLGHHCFWFISLLFF